MKKTIDGAAVHASVINAVAKGIVLANDRSLLVENGGCIIFRGLNFLSSQMFFYNDQAKYWDIHKLRVSGRIVRTQKLENQ